MSEKKAGRIILFNEDGKVLLGRRSSKIGFGELSILGGKPDENEGIVEAAIREVEEETGYQVKNPIFFIERDYEGWLTYFYSVIVPNLFTPSPNEEHSEFLLLSQKEIKAIEDQIAFNHYAVLMQFFETETNSGQS